MKKNWAFNFFKFAVLAYLSFALGFFASLGVLIGGKDLFFPASYSGNAFPLESLAHFLLGAGGLLGLVGLWVATLYRNWYRKTWLRRSIFVLLLCGICSGGSLIFFWFHTYDGQNFEAIGVLGMLVLPIVWGCLLLTKIGRSDLASFTHKGVEPI